jgi:hypothetical protein
MIVRIDRALARAVLTCSLETTMEALHYCCFGPGVRDALHPAPVKRLCVNDPEVCR